MMETFEHDSSDIRKVENSAENTEVLLEDAKESSPESFEAVLKIIRPLSWWQAWIYGWFSYLEFFLAFINLSVIFYQITPDHACDVPQQNESFTHPSSWTIEQFRNFTSPLTKDGDHDQCQIYNVDYSAITNLSYDAAKILRNKIIGADAGVLKCDKWIYNQSYMVETIVTQWDLVCDNKWWVEHGTMVNYFGLLVGSFVSGPYSDRFGRRTAIITFVLLYAILGVVLSFTPSYLWFIPTRFLIQVGRMGASLSIFCYALETTSSRLRVWIGGLFFVPYALGYAALAGVAYLVPYWKTMHIIISAPSILVIVLFWVIPESPRWLVAKAHYTKADKVLRNAARINRRVLPENIDYEKIARNLAVRESETKQKTVHFFHVFKYKILAFRAVILYFIWFVNAMVYYGLSLNVSSFAGNLFLNNAVAGLVEIPGFFLCTALLAWGRKPANYVCLLLCGSTLMAIPWVPKDLVWLKITLAMIGKLGITASFSAIYVITTELYPTVIRNSGLSTSSAVGRIGSMTAPYISGLAKLGKSYGWLPMVVFGGFSLLAGFFTLFLPETKGKKMPEQLEDALGLLEESGEQSKKKEDATATYGTEKLMEPAKA